MATGPHTFESIDRLTSFAAGDLFESPRQVRAYFTVANMRCTFPDAEDYDGKPDAEELAEMAEDVIRHRWHMRG